MMEQLSDARRRAPGEDEEPSYASAMWVPWGGHPQGQQRQEQQHPQHYHDPQGQNQHHHHHQQRQQQQQQQHHQDPREQPAPSSFQPHDPTPPHQAQTQTQQQQSASTNGPLTSALSRANSRSEAVARLKRAASQREMRSRPSEPTPPQPAAAAAPSASVVVRRDDASVDSAVEDHSAHQRGGTAMGGDEADDEGEEGEGKEDLDDDDEDRVDIRSGAAGAGREENLAAPYDHAREQSVEDVDGGMEGKLAHANRLPRLPDPSDVPTESVDALAATLPAQHELLGAPLHAPLSPSPSPNSLVRSRSRQDRSPLPSLEQLRARILQERETAGLQRSASASAASAVARNYALNKLLGKSFREGAVSPASEGEGDDSDVDVEAASAGAAATRAAVPSGSGNGRAGREDAILPPSTPPPSSPTSRGPNSQGYEPTSPSRRASVMQRQRERATLRRSRTIGGLSAMAEAQRKAAFIEGSTLQVPGDGQPRRSSRRFAHGPSYRTRGESERESQQDVAMTVEPTAPEGPAVVKDPEGGPNLTRKLSQRQIARTEMIRKLSGRRAGASAVPGESRPARSGGTTAGRSGRTDAPSPSNPPPPPPPPPPLSDQSQDAAGPPVASPSALAAAPSAPEALSHLAAPLPSAASPRSPLIALHPDEGAVSASLAVPAPSTPSRSLLSPGASSFGAHTPSGASTTGLPSPLARERHRSSSSAASSYAHSAISNLTARHFAERDRASAIARDEGEEAFYYEDMLGRSRSRIGAEDEMEGAVEKEPSSAAAAAAAAVAATETGSSVASPAPDRASVGEWPAEGLAHDEREDEEEDVFGAPPARPWVVSHGGRTASSGSIPLALDSMGPRASRGFGEAGAGHATSGASTAKSALGRSSDTERWPESVGSNGTMSVPRKDSSSEAEIAASSAVAAAAAAVAAAQDPGHRPVGLAHRETISEEAEAEAGAAPTAPTSASSLQPRPRGPPLTIDAKAAAAAAAAQSPSYAALVSPSFVSEFGNPLEMANSPASAASPSLAPVVQPPMRRSSGAGASMTTAAASGALGAGTRSSTVSQLTSPGARLSVATSSPAKRRQMTTSSMTESEVGYWELTDWDDVAGGAGSYTEGDLTTSSDDELPAAETGNPSARDGAAELRGAVEGTTPARLERLAAEDAEGTTAPGDTLQRSAPAQALAEASEWELVEQRGGSGFEVTAPEDAEVTSPPETARPAKEGFAAATGDSSAAGGVAETTSDHSATLLRRSVSSTARSATSGDHTSRAPSPSSPPPPTREPPDAARHSEQEPPAPPRGSSLSASSKAPARVSDAAEVAPATVPAADLPARYVNEKLMPFPGLLPGARGAGAPRGGEMQQLAPATPSWASSTARSPGIEATGDDASSTTQSHSSPSVAGREEATATAVPSSSPPRVLSPKFFTTLRRKASGKALPAVSAAGRRFFEGIPTRHNRGASKDALPSATTLGSASSTAGSGFESNSVGGSSSPLTSTSFASRGSEQRGSARRDQDDDIPVQVIGPAPQPRQAPHAALSRNASLASQLPSRRPTLRGVPTGVDAATDAGLAAPPASTAALAATSALAPGTAAILHRYSHILTSSTDTAEFAPAMPGLTPEAVANPPRRLVHAGPVLQVVTNHMVKDRFLLLFNDILVVAKPVAPPLPNAAGTSGAPGPPEDEARKLPTLRWSFLVKNIVELRGVRLIVQPERAPAAARRRDHPLMQAFVRQFSMDADAALARVLAQSSLPSGASTVAQLLHQTPELDRDQLTRYLCEAAPGRSDVLAAYVDLQRQAGVSIESALRSLLLNLRFPRVPDAFERLLTTFAQRWTVANRTLIKHNFSVELAVNLVFAIMALNDALHGADARAQAPGFFSDPLPTLSRAAFLAAFRTHDPEAVLSDRTLLRIYVSVDADPIAQGLARDEPGPRHAIRVHAPGLPHRLVYGVPSEPVTVSIPQTDPEFAIRLYGQDLAFDPPVLSFDAAPTQTFRVTSRALGAKHAVFVRAGRTARYYVGSVADVGLDAEASDLPASQPMAVERAFMQNLFTLQLGGGGHPPVAGAGAGVGVGAAGTRRKYMFSVEGRATLDAWQSALRTQIEEAGRAIGGGGGGGGGASDAMGEEKLRLKAAADALALHVLRETLIAGDDAAAVGGGAATAAATSGLQRSQSSVTPRSTPGLLSRAPSDSRYLGRGGGGPAALSAAAAAAAAGGVSTPSSAHNVALVGRNTSISKHYYAGAGRSERELLLGPTPPPPAPATPTTAEATSTSTAAAGSSPTVVGGGKLGAVGSSQASAAPIHGDALVLTCTSNSLLSLVLDALSVKV